MHRKITFGAISIEVPHVCWHSLLKKCSRFNILTSVRGRPTAIPHVLLDAAMQSKFSIAPMAEGAAPPDGSHLSWNLGDHSKSIFEI